jgi:hypothetical protein
MLRDEGIRIFLDFMICQCNLFAYYSRYYSEAIVSFFKLLLKTINRRLIMKNIIKSGLVAALVLTFCSVMTMDAATKTQTKAKKRDGSCLKEASDASSMTLAATKTQTKAKKRDGSCLK